MTEIVAEVSGNHGGKLLNALLLIEQAADAGADAVKFQCFDPARLAKRRANNPEVLALAGDELLVDLYRRTWTPKPWFPELIECANEHGLKWFSSVFSPEDVAFLETLGCPRYKISAFEMLDWDIIKAVRETGKPVVMSVRPRPDVTVLVASKYDGTFLPLGASVHERHNPDTHFLPSNPDCPMVEFHLKLEGVETPDSAFSVTADELHDIIGWLK